MNNFDEIVRKILIRLKDVDTQRKIRRYLPTALTCISVGIAVTSAFKPAQTKQLDPNVTIVYNNYSREDSNEQHT